MCWTFGIAARNAREKAGLAVQEVIKFFHFSRQTLNRIENGSQSPDPKTVKKMAALYNEPDLLRIHCKRNCPIGQDLNYVVPNNIQNDFTVTAARAMKESKEHYEVCESLLFKSFAKDMDRQLIHKEMKEMLEAEFWIEQCKIEYIRRFGIESLQEIIREVNADYLHEGIVIDEFSVQTA